LPVRNGSNRNLSEPVSRYPAEWPRKVNFIGFV
jgi:hypothetical protein